jgi:hypothetical protein
VFTPPEGPAMSVSVARDLDDSYFQSRPFSYFASRIASLVASAQLCRRKTTGVWKLIS